MDGTEPTAADAVAPSSNGAVAVAAADDPAAPTSAASAADVDSHPSRTYVPDLAPIRASEKKRLDFAGKMWMAPLTTVGNLPFRRLAVEYGCDITTSEMGLAQEFLSGNANEWSLVRRHPSERTFGVQICGSKPQVLVPAAEAIVKSTEIDFLGASSLVSLSLVCACALADCPVLARRHQLRVPDRPRLQQGRRLGAPRARGQARQVARRHEQGARRGAAHGQDPHGRQQQPADGAQAHAALPEGVGRQRCNGTSPSLSPLIVAASAR